jgi:hypothetical protein
MYGGKDEGVYMDSTYNLFYPKGSMYLKASGRGGGGEQYRFEYITSFNKV